MKKNLAPATNLGTFKGGSLPNVSEQNRKQQTTNAQVVDAINNTSKKVFFKYSAWVTWMHIKLLCNRKLLWLFRMVEQKWNIETYEELQFSLKPIWFEKVKCRKSHFTPISEIFQFFVFFYFRFNLYFQSNVLRHAYYLLLISMVANEIVGTEPNKIKTTITRQ